MIWFATCYTCNFESSCWAQVFLKVLCLVTFIAVPEWEFENGSLDLCDFFSGKARVSKLASWVGYRVRSYDLTYEPVAGDPGQFKRGQLPRSPMDLNGAAGFATLGLENLKGHLGGN